MEKEQALKQLLEESECFGVMFDEEAQECAVCDLYALCRDNAFGRQLPPLQQETLLYLEEAKKYKQKRYA